MYIHATGDISANALSLATTAPPGVFGPDSSPPPCGITASPPRTAESRAPRARPRPRAPYSRPPTESPIRTRGAHSLGHLPAGAHELTIHGPAIVDDLVEVVEI